MKYLPVCLVFILLIFCGGIASRTLFPVSLEKNLAKQSSRILKGAGVDYASEQYAHYFVSLAGEIPEITTGPVVLEHIGGKVWGVAIPEEDPARPSSKFSAKLQGDTVVLEGVVSSSDFPKAIEKAALASVGTEKVENQIAINEELPEMVWKDSLPDFVKDYFSYSGTTHLLVSSRGITLGGEVASREVREKLGVRAAEFVSSPAIVNNQLSVQKPRYPSFKIHGTADGLKLSGLLPDEATRLKLISAIQEALPETKFTDEVRITAGVAKPWWLTNAKSVIPTFLAETGGLGSIEYWKNRLQVDGKVGSETFEKKLKSIPLGPEKPEDFSIHSNISLRPEREPSMEIKEDDKGRFIASGSVGASSVKSAVLETLIAHDPDVVILDQISVSHQVKDYGWSNTAELVKEAVLETEGGSISINGQSVTLEGEVESAERKETLVSLVADVLGDDSEIENLLVVNEPPADAPTLLVEEPEVDFKEVAIYFRSGSSELGGPDFDKLSKTAGLINSLNPDTKVIVGGFADNRGNAEANERLSQRRASAVLDYLKNLGISEDRMRIKTFGEDVSNVKQSDLWKSRRVELSVDRE